MISPPFKRTLLATLAGTGKPPELTFGAIPNPADHRHWCGALGAGVHSAEEPAMTLHLYRRTLVATTIENAYPRPPARELTEAEQRALYFWLHKMLWERAEEKAMLDGVTELATALRGKK